MDEIKSAREIALAKTAELGETTEDERLKWKYTPEGEKLAAKCLNGKIDLNAELSRHKEKGKRYVVKGAEKVLIVNISLPKNDMVKSKNKKAMDALMSLKNDKESVKKVFEDIGHVFDHYNNQGEPQRHQAYESIKARFVSAMRQALEKQAGSLRGIEINVESLPQFQEEWRRTLAQLDSQYIELLEGYKQKLKGID